MMNNPPISKNFCFGCLSDEKFLQNYVFQSGPLKEIFQMSSILLCYLCKRMAQNAELFIQSVQGNQILMENCDLLSQETLKAIHSQTQQLVNLNITSLPSLELYENTNITESFIITSSKKELEVKSEMKEEVELCLEAEFLDSDDFPESYVKEEDDFPLKALLKEELQLNIEDMHLMDTINSHIKSKKKKIKKNKLLKSSKIKTEILDESKESKIKLIVLTKKQYLDERAKMLADKKYQDLTYKCDLCIKGYTFKGCYDKHMEKHSESYGNYQCDICKQYLCSEEKLAIHMKYHTHRYQCMECGIIRNCRRTIRDHYDRQHLKSFDLSHCFHCKKTFKHPTSLRKHIAYAHTNKQERVQCAYCLRTFANKTVLRSHIMAKHTKDMPPGENPYKYICRECGASFKAPSQLRMHSVKHSNAKDYYCVECDRSFKSESILKHHLTTTAIHVSYTEMQYPCLQCERRFTIRRDLDRHTNRVHLNIRPFACDRCDKTYVNNWSLKHHKQIAHEGYKRPLQYPCPMCDKIFDRNHILKSHIRTHTGERPYQCTKCPAKFNQASVLRTHDRLIHLKLMRNGKPKHGTFK